MSKLQSMSTAPKDGTHILLYVEACFIEGWWGKSWGEDQGEWQVVALSIHGCGCCSMKNDEPKGWMPLPEVDAGNLK